MMQMTLQISDKLAEQIEPIGNWLPAILEISLIKFKSMATVTASEVIEFLSKNPSPEEVLEYHVSERAQNRLQRLLALNEAGLLAADEELELDELQRLEHVVVMLKAQTIADKG